MYRADVFLSLAPETSVRTGARRSTCKSHVSKRDLCGTKRWQSDCIDGCLMLEARKGSI
jgi:hypothetical protein